MKNHIDRYMVLSHLIHVRSVFKGCGSIRVNDRFKTLEEAKKNIVESIEGHRIFDSPTHAVQFWVLDMEEDKLVYDQFFLSQENQTEADILPMERSSRLVRRKGCPAPF